MNETNTVKDLLNKFVSSLASWETEGSYYLTKYIPNLKSNYLNTSDQQNGKIFKLLKSKLSIQEWDELSVLVQETRNNNLRSIQSEIQKKNEQEKFILKEDTKKKERLKKLELLKTEEKIKLQKAAMLIKQKVLFHDKIYQEFLDVFQNNFLEADNFYKANYVNELSPENYNKAKSKFIIHWIKKNTNSDVDHEQALAIGSYGTDLHVIARAGSGKTRTIVFRAVFLQLHCKVPPQHILLLVFNNNASKEITKRLSLYLKAEIPLVLTFHALAYAIINPGNALITEDSSKKEHIKNTIDEFLNKSQYRDKIKNTMLNYFKKDWDTILKYEDNYLPKEYLEFKKSCNHYSLNREKVSSTIEKLFADFLFEHNIEYNYKKNPLPYFELTRYYRIKIKIKLINSSVTLNRYQKNNNEHIFDIGEDILKNISIKEFNQELKVEFEKLNIECIHLSDQEIYKKLQSKIKLEFTDISKDFIQRCRQLSLSILELDNLIKDFIKIDKEQEVFLNLMRDLYSKYNLLDFEALIQKSIIKIKSGVTTFYINGNNYNLRDLKFLFVDEYQDFTEAFYKILCSIREKNNSFELFAVGDDWQGIYGFAGSNLKFFTDFKNYFKYSNKLNLLTNYRSDSKIVEIGNRFMDGLGEPAKSHTQNKGKILIGYLNRFILTNREKYSFSSDPCLIAILKIIYIESNSNKQIVLLSRKNEITRNNNKINIETYCNKIKSFLDNNLSNKISVSTIHRYKGLENDIVIIMDVDTSNFPFINSKWQFTKIFGNSFQNIIAEEKRLFYVAMSRAIHTLIFLTNTDTPSLFLDTLIKNQSIEYIDFGKYQSYNIIGEEINITISGKSTFNIKELLKKEKYHWDASNTSWYKNFPTKNFNLSIIQQSSWISSALNLDITIEYNTNNVKTYRVKDGVLSDFDTL